MAWADLLLPENQLRLMLAECQPWRAIVANPAGTWATIAEQMDDGTIAEGNAATRIKTGVLVDDCGDPSYVQRPRAAVSHSDADGFSRSSVSTHDMTGRLFVLVELTIPPSLESADEKKDDVRSKALAITFALLGLPRINPRLDITAINVESGVLYRQENNGDEFGVVQMDVTYAGVA